MCKNLSKLYDVELLYKQCDINQLKRLRQYVKCEVYDPNKEYKCDICLLASSWGGYPDSVISTKNEYWQMIHANYKEANKTFNYKYVPFSKTTKHIAVSKIARDVFKEMYGYECGLMYNILDEVKETKPILKLVSATRLSAEKGYNRMVKLANELKKKNIKFRWLIFTDLAQYNIKPMQMEEIIYMQPRYDLFDYIKEANYGVQLSDTEGYSYFVNECLQYGTPTLTSSFDSIYESVEDGVSGYILPFELFESGTKEEWDKYLDKIVNKIPKDFKYEPKTKIEDWVKIIGKPSKKEKYVYEEKGTEVEVIKPCFYTLENKQCKKGDYLVIEDEERLNDLINRGYVKLI